MGAACTEQSTELFFVNDVRARRKNRPYLPSLPPIEAFEYIPAAGARLAPKWITDLMWPPGATALIVRRCEALIVCHSDTARAPRVRRVVRPSQRRLVRQPVL